MTPACRMLHGIALEPIVAIEATMLTCCTRADDEHTLAPLAAILFDPFGHVETGLRSVGLRQWSVSLASFSTHRTSLQ